MWSRWRWCTTGIAGGSRGPGSISSAGGFAWRLCCGCGRCDLVAFSPDVRVWSHAFDSVALRAVWCCVRCFVSATPVRVECFLPLLAAWDVACVLLFLCWTYGGLQVYIRLLRFLQHQHVLWSCVLISQCMFMESRQHLHANRSRSEYCKAGVICV